MQNIIIGNLACVISYYGFCCFGGSLAWVEVEALVDGVGCERVARIVCETETENIGKTNLIAKMERTGRKNTNGEDGDGGSGSS